MYAFRCRNCNLLVAAGAAGEEHSERLDEHGHLVPAACPLCGHGVRFDPVTGIKAYDPDNWIVLADLEGNVLDDVLDYHKIDASDIGGKLRKVKVSE